MKKRLAWIVYIIFFPIYGAIIALMMSNNTLSSFVLWLCEPFFIPFSVLTLCSGVLIGYLTQVFKRDFEMSIVILLIGVVMAVVVYILTLSIMFAYVMSDF